MLLYSSTVVKVLCLVLFPVPILTVVDMFESNVYTVEIVNVSRLVYYLLFCFAFGYTLQVYQKDYFLIREK